MLDGFLLTRVQTGEKIHGKPDSNMPVAPIPPSEGAF